MLSESVEDGFRFRPSLIPKPSNKYSETVPCAWYRDKAQREADIVLERNNGDVVAIEVKAAATIREDDFRGIKYLRDKLGSRFRAGAVLFAGDKTLPFGDRLAAVPIAGLWEA